MIDAGTIDQNILFSLESRDFDSMALTVFKFQYSSNQIYRQYCDLIHCDPQNVSEISDIPFLPISFFKNKEVITTPFIPQLIFESSKTTGAIASRHFIKDKLIYEESYLRGFKLFYGNPQEYCILGLLPSYLERQNSSLVHMVEDLIRRSKNPHSGFYLNDFKKLHQTLKHNEEAGQRTLLIGVTFALLDFVSEYPLPLHYTTVMETGGMKGRKKEMTREEVHRELKEGFTIPAVHSEYGMTELLSQAYAIKDGVFSCPPWMRMLVRDADDPFVVQDVMQDSKPINGLGNVIDLANIYSCSFIATDDVVRLHPGSTFEILGRADNSDIRGCSLMVNAI